MIYGYQGLEASKIFTPSLLFRDQKFALTIEILDHCWSNQMRIRQRNSFKLLDYNPRAINPKLGLFLPDR